MQTLMLVQPCRPSGKQTGSGNIIGDEQKLQLILRYHGCDKMESLYVRQLTEPAVYGKVLQSNMKCSYSIMFT